MAGTVAEWGRVGPTIKTKIDYREVVIKSFQLPDGRHETRATYSAETFRAAGVIAVTTEGQVVIARQFRPGPEKVMDELPGGNVDTGEDPESAARRELLEETGYEPENMKFIGEFSRDAYMNGRWYYYLATGCKMVAGQSLDYNEFVDIINVSISEFIDSAKKGRMTDGIAVLAAYDDLKGLERET